MEWDSSWNIGINSIDGQHRNILRAINALEEGKEQVLKKTFAALEAYARIHFDQEMQLLERHQFPNLAGHYREHENFLLQLRKFEQACLVAGDTQALIKEVRLYLVNWLNVHINEVDRGYVDFLRSKGVT